MSPPATVTHRPMSADRCVLLYEHGTLVLPHEPPPCLAGLLVADPRSGVWRAPGRRYRDIVLALRTAGIPVDDQARAFAPVELPIVDPFVPLPHQATSLAAWIEAGQRGVVVLPTGAGKTMLSMLAIEKTGRPTLVVVPTLTLVAQWRQNLAQRFGVPIGQLADGVHDRQTITVATYDSAVGHVEFHGNRVGLLVFDECHHLPAPATRFIAEASIAPFRLGLTATPERTDGGERWLDELIGPTVHRVDIGALEGSVLAPYEARRIEVHLTAEEQARHDAARKQYRDFVRGAGISMGAPDGWRRFLVEASRSPEGRAALQAWRDQRRIAFGSAAKDEALWEIIRSHPGERVLVFTEDNETVYRLSKRWLLPSITHVTPATERATLLAAFASGALPVLLTSKVLNEGVDVPAASVAVILSGNGSVREHVQRLGRILRRAEGKRALLYEICAAGTGEEHTSDRRRRHHAYERSTSVPRVPGAGPAGVSDGA